MPVLELRVISEPGPQLDPYLNFQFTAESRTGSYLNFYRLNPKEEKLKGSLELKTERSSLEHYAPETYLSMSTS